MKIFYLNAQSLLGHKSEIESLLNEQHIDILSISETWLYPDINNSFVNIHSYNLYREDHGRGGGVCFYIKDHLKVTELDGDIDKQQGVEVKWLSVQLRYHPSFIIGCFYRHPKAHVVCLI